MSICTLPTAGATLIGISGLAQIQSAPLDVWEKFGITGLLILVVVALWKDGKNEMKAAQERRDKRDADEAAYRERREAAETKRMEEFLQTLGSIQNSIEEQQNKCSMTNYLLGELRKDREK